MHTEVITVRTGSRPVVRDITREAERFLDGQGDGLLHVFVPHATAGVAIIETGSGSDDDLLTALDDLLPTDDRWRHRHGSPGHGRDHVLPAFVPPYATRAGPGRPPGPGHLAVDLPGRPQRRQPHPPGPPLLPPRLTPARLAPAPRTSRHPPQNPARAHFQRKSGYPPPDNHSFSARVSILGARRGVARAWGRGLRAGGLLGGGVGVGGGDRDWR